MIEPVEATLALPVTLNGTESNLTAVDVWRMLTACRDGDLDQVSALVADSPALVLSAYNYMAPLHLAVREGHRELVQYLIGHGAANPNYVTYPYRETLLDLANDRGHEPIATLLRAAYATGDHTRKEEEEGEIQYVLDAAHQRFQQLLNSDSTAPVEAMLTERPELALNPVLFWAEGALMMPAKRGHRGMMELLVQYGARVPTNSKWGSWYYLDRYESASWLLDHGMDPNHMNCHHTTVLHDMAYKGDTRKAELLLDHGAAIDAIDEEFQSTPLGLAARWGHVDMVKVLLRRGANPNRSGASWSTPLA